MISCWCLTGGRINMLEEAIECFHRQDYTGEKELLIINTHPGVQIRYEHPEAVVVNLPRKPKTLGELRNFAASISHGDVLTNWDDDDIHLPWRLRVGKAYLDDGYDYFRPHGCWSWPVECDPMLCLPSPLYSFYAATAMFTRQCFQAVGGYAPSHRILDDQLFDHEAEIRGMRSFRDLMPISDYAYMYRTRWSWNLSLHGDMGFDITWPPEKSGDVVLQPHWDRDYTVIAAAAIAHLNVRDVADSTLNSPERMELLLKTKGKR